MGRNGRRLRVEPTDEWEQIELLCGWPEQRDYELIRPLVLFGGPASERAGATGAASERTLQRRVIRFEAEGMESSWRDHGVGKWLAYERSTGALVGRGGPSWAVVEGVGCVEIGWAFRVAVWGRGYATEIGSFGLDHVFSVLGVEEVVSFTEVHNARSRAVMERLGMRHVGQILRPGFIEGSDVVHEAAPFALYRIARPGERKKVGARRWMYRGAIPTFASLPRKLPQESYALQSPGSGVCRQESHHHVDDG